MLNFNRVAQLHWESARRSCTLAQLFTALVLVNSLSDEGKHERNGEIITLWLLWLNEARGRAWTSGPAGEPFFIKAGISKLSGNNFGLPGNCQGSNSSEFFFKSALAKSNIWAWQFCHHDKFHHRNKQRLLNYKIKKNSKLFCFLLSRPASKKLFN